MNKTVLNKPEISRSLTRIAHEILERNKGSKEVALIGIQAGGVFMAHRLGNIIKKLDPFPVPLGELDITLYRDDLGSRKESPVIRKTLIPFDLTGLRVVLVDDVLFTGRTIRAAMDGLVDLGRPQQIQLAVLIDRGHRELPISADFVGKNLPTALCEKVEVQWEERGEEDRVLITG
jgi:pyrimidine operon attenuation protein/uracil phosphoribosyltransferase